MPTGSEATRGRTVQRLAILGLDGADLDLIGPWLDDGRLPTLASLRRRGVCARLASTVPPLSPEAWSSFATGTNPGKHGVIGFAQPKPSSYDLRFSNGAVRRGQTLWQILGESGLRVGVINVPMTYPPQPVNGFMISGPDTPGAQSEFTYPAELKQELLAAVGSYEIHGDYWGRVTPQEYLRRLIETVESQSVAWEYLLQRFKPDFFVGVFGSTDRAQHFLLKYAPGIAGTESGEDNPLLLVYQAVDRALGRILSHLGDEVTIIVMSDHGGGPCDKAIYLDRWLQEQGLLSYLGQRNWPRSSVRRVYQLARAFLPRSAKDWVKSKWVGVRQQIEGAVLRDPIDWGRTQAFFLGTESAYIYLNVRGRFPQGIVAPGREAEAVRQRIIAQLSSLRDPETGQPVVGSIHRREEIYHGEPEHLALLPDLVVNWKDYRYVVRRAWGEPAASPGVIVERGLRTGDAGRLMSLELSGCHRPEGLLIMAGPGISPNAQLEGARIIDLAPTALHWFGQPVPTAMDGRVLRPSVTGADAEAETEGPRP